MYGVGFSCGGIVCRSACTEGRLPQDSIDLILSCPLALTPNPGLDASEEGLAREWQATLDLRGEAIPSNSPSTHGGCSCSESEQPAIELTLDWLRCRMEW